MYFEIKYNKLIHHFNISQLFEESRLRHSLSVDDLHQPLYQCLGDLLVPAAPHLVQGVMVDLVVIVNIECGVTIKILQRTPDNKNHSYNFYFDNFFSPFHVSFLPEFVREVSHAEPQHPQTKNAPPDLDAGSILVLAHRQHRHPHVDEPHVTEHSPDVDVEHVFIKTNHLGS